MEEQKRELQPESEREQAIEESPSASPRRHFLPDSIKRLVLTSRLSSWQELISLSESFDGTRPKSLAPEIGNWGKDLFVSRDFHHTVNVPNEDVTDVWLGL